MPIATIATAPTISGTITAGATGNVLTCSTGTWTTDSTITSYSYQWQRTVAAGINIPGATSSTYTTTTNDSGYPLKCIVVANNASGASAGAISSNSLTMWVSNINTPVLSNNSITVNTIAVSALDNLPTAYQFVESKQTNLGTTVTIAPDTSSFYVNTGSVLVLDNLPTAYQFVESKQTNLVASSIIAPDAVIFNTNSSAILVLDNLPTAYQFVESKQTNLVANNTISPDKVLLSTTGSVIVSYATYILTDNANIEKGTGTGGSATNQQTWTLGV